MTTLRSSWQGCKRKNRRRWRNERQREVLTYYQKLEECYDRLAEVLAAGDAADPDEIKKLAAESEEIIAALSGMAPPEGEPGRSWPGLLHCGKKPVNS